MPVPRKFVVAGLVVDGDRILVSQRTAAQNLPLQWEFPGGKIELGEPPEAALVRELREELGVDVEVGRVWEVLHHLYDDFELLMLVYLARVVAGEPRAVEVADIAWARPAELDEFDILEADRPLVLRLQREGTPIFPRSV